MQARAEGDTFMQTSFGPYVGDRIRGQRGYVFVNCWSMSEHESAAMWTLYLDGAQGVAIRSTFSRLCDSLSRVALAREPDNGMLNVGRVEYIDYAKDGFGARRLSEGRAQLRRLARERDTGAGGVMGPASEAE